MNQAFVYKWTHKPSMNYYIGSRTAQGCHPDDGYICSSKIVKPMIQQNYDEWERTIISIGDPKEMRSLENEILMLFDCKNDPKSFNLHNGNGDFGLTGIKLTKEHRKKIANANKKIFSTPEKKQQARNRMLGKKTGVVPKTAFKTGHIPWNKGLTFKDQENNPWKNNGGHSRKENF